MLHIGIDPGKTGCIVLLHEDGKVEIEMIKKIAGSKLVDEQKLNMFFKTIKKIQHHVVLEDVHAVYGSSAAAMFSFGDICGLIRGLIIANDLSYTKIAPKKWQEEMFQGIPEIRKPNTKDGKRGKLDTKTMSIAAAKRLFPKVSLKTNNSARAVDQNGISDALLMAGFSKRKFK